MSKALEKIVCRKCGQPVGLVEFCSNCGAANRLTADEVTWLVQHADHEGP